MFYPVEYNQFQHQYGMAQDAAVAGQDPGGRRRNQQPIRSNQIDPMAWQQQQQAAFFQADPQQQQQILQQMLMAAAAANQNNQTQNYPQPQMPMMTSMGSGYASGHRSIDSSSPDYPSRQQSNLMLTDANEEPIILTDSKLKQLQQRLKRGSIVLQNHIRLPNYHHYGPENPQKTMRKFMDKCHECRDEFRGKSFTKKRPPSRAKYLMMGAFMFVSAFMYFALQDVVVDFILESQLQLNPGNIFVSFAWVTPPISFSSELYLFELRNSKQFLSGARPNVKEVGPFVFKMGRERRILEWTDDSVKFMEKLIADFDQDNSKYSINTTLTVINTPIVGTISWAYYWMDKYMITFLNPVIHNVLTVTLQAFGESLVEQRTAREILLGRPVNLLRFLDSLAAPLKAVNVPIPEYMSLLTSYGNYKLSNLSFSIIGLIAGMEFGPLEFYRKATSGHRANQAKSSHGSTVYDHYKPPCNQILGIDPMIFGMHDQGKYFDMFQLHFCRNIRFVYNKTEYVGGVRAARYVADIDMFSMRPEENRCYCFGDRTLSECDGYTDISGCFGGLPMALTHPHFLGSKRLQSTIFGFEPDPDRHLSRIDIEPYTGIINSGQIGLQYNLLLRNFPSFGQLGRIRPGLMPYFSISLNLKIEGFLGYVMIAESFALTYGKYLMTLLLLAISMLYFFLAMKYPSS